MRKLLCRQNSTSPLSHYAVAGFLVLAVLAVWKNVPQMAPGLKNWAESGNVAAAVVEGRGFSDPFAGGTGATAWVPPGFVWLVAAAFWAAGVKSTASSLVLLVSSVLLLAAAHAYLTAIVVRNGDWARRVASAAFLLMAALSPWTPLILLSEAPLQIFLSMLLLWAAVEHLAQPRRTTAVALTVAAVLGPLSHAGLAVAVALILAGLWITALRGQRRAIVLAGMIGAAGVGLWTARNGVALGKFVPLKSNFWFELHLANIASPEGFPRAETVLRQMPYFNSVQFDRYARLGELAYVESFHAPAREGIAAEPRRFILNVIRRAGSAFVFCSTADGSMATRFHFSPSDSARLTEAGLLLPYAGINLASWTRVDMPPTQAHSAIVALRLQHFPQVWADWAEKHQAYRDQHYGARGLLLGFASAGLPTLAWLGMLLAAHGRISRLATCAVLILAGMSLPFVLVNHSMRHQAPQLAIQAVAIGLCLQAWLDRLADNSQSGGFTPSQVASA